MKRFFIKGITFFLIGYLFLFYTYNYLLTGQDDEKYLIKKYLRNKDKIEAISIGTSHAWAINFKSIGIEGIGLGLGGRDLTESKYILEYLLAQKNNNIKKVFISIAYFSLYQDNNQTDGSIIDTRAFMYNNITSWKMLKGDLKNFIMGKFLPFIQSDHWRTIVIKNIRKLNFQFNKGKVEAVTNKVDFHQKNKDIPLKEIKARVSAQHRIHERAEKNKKYNTKKYYLNILKQTIIMLKKKGIEPIFFTPPYYYKYTELYNKKYIKEIKYEMNEFVEKYDVKYLDFSMDPDFIYESKYFKDADHLNLESTRIFGEKIRKLISG